MEILPDVSVFEGEAIFDYQARRGMFIPYKPDGKLDFSKAQSFTF